MQKTAIEHIREFYSAGAIRGVSVVGSYMYWGKSSMEELKHNMRELGYGGKIQKGKFHHMGVWHLPINDLFKTKQ